MIKKIKKELENAINKSTVAEQVGLQKAIDIINDLSEKENSDYQYSKDYDKLFELVNNKNKRIFCRVMNTRIDAYDYATVYKTKGGTINCGIRGLSYFEVYEWSVEYCKGCKTFKDVFLEYCKAIELEFIIP